LRQELKRKKEEREELYLELSHREEEVERKRRELVEIEARIEGIKGLLSSLELGKLEAKVVESAKKGKVKGFVGLLINLISVEPGYEKLIESYLKPFGAGIVLRDFSSILWVKERIKGNGRLYLFSLEAPEVDSPEIEGAKKLAELVSPKDDRLKGLIKALFYGVYYAPDRAVELAKKYPQFVFIDREFNQLSARGSLVGPFKGSSLLALEREVKELEKELERKREELEEKRRELSPVREEIEQVESEIESLKEKEESLREELYKLKFKLEQSEKGVKELSLKLNELQKREQRARELLSSLSDRLSRYREKLSELEERKRALVEETSRVEGEISAFTKEVEEKREELSRLSSRKGVLLEKLRALKEKVKAKEASFNSLKREIDALDERVEKDREELEKARKALKRALELLSGVDESIEEIRKELTELEKRREELSHLLLGKEKALKQRREELSQVSKRLKESELNLARLTVKEEELVKKILELDSSVSVALELSERVKDEEESRRELINLKERISRLGAVNLLAVEEYEKIKERYGFILEQEKDLLDSIKNLKEALKRLDSEIERRFVSTFNAVNRHFKSTVRRIFGGGTGRLYLSSQEISEAGLEIEVKPPGKRHSNINLLSGGERTLVAIAFLYSLYSVRPAPFLVLDEVDAALDDANTLRFVELLKQMAEETQVIIVTHNKLTMEAADVLYGVTMEVPGVSKVVGVSFESLVGG